MTASGNNVAAIWHHRQRAAIWRKYLNENTGNNLNEAMSGGNSCSGIISWPAASGLSSASWPAAISVISL